MVPHKSLLSPAHAHERKEALARMWEREHERARDSA